MQLYVHSFFDWNIYEKKLNLYVPSYQQGRTHIQLPVIFIYLQSGHRVIFFLGPPLQYNKDHL
jgi:hypothetical protein